MRYCDGFWHTDAHKNILSPTCLTVFVKSKINRPTFRLTSRPAVRETWWSVLVWTRPDFITPDLWPPNSADLNTVDYRIRGVLQ